MKLLPTLPRRDSTRTRRSSDADGALLDPVRARLCRRVKVAASVATVALVVVPLHLSATGAFALLGERAWQAGEADAAARWFARADRLDVLERWKAPYGRGVAAFSQGDWLQSAELFERAQATVPEESLCRVVLNRALALETLGDELDEHDDPAGARSRWAEAQAVLAEAEGCSADGAGDEGESDESDPADSSSEGQDQEGDKAGEEEGQQDAAEEESSTDGSGSDPARGQGASGEPAEGSGAPSEQERLASAATRLQEKVSGKPASSNGPAQEPSEEQKAAELAERSSGAARTRSTIQDGAGPVGQPEPGVPTW